MVKPNCVGPFAACCALCWTLVIGLCYNVTKLSLIWSDCTTNGLLSFARSTRVGSLTLCKPELLRFLLSWEWYLFYLDIYDLETHLGFKAFKVLFSILAFCCISCGVLESCCDFRSCLKTEFYLSIIKLKSTCATYLTCPSPSCIIVETDCASFLPSFLSSLTGLDCPKVIVLFWSLIFIGLLTEKRKLVPSTLLAGSYYLCYCFLWWSWILLWGRLCCDTRAVC